LSNGKVGNSVRDLDRDVFRLAKSVNSLTRAINNLCWAVIFLGVLLCLTAFAVLVVVAFG